LVRLLFFWQIGIASLLSVASSLRAAGASVVVVDSDALVADPEGMLTELCLRLGIAFDRAMLRWPAGPKPFDGLWAPHWYSSVHKSTSFLAPSRAPPRFPTHGHALLLDALPFYDALRRAAIAPTAPPPTLHPSTMLAKGSAAAVAKMPDPRNAEHLLVSAPHDSLARTPH
jgi:hypothetical protein